MREYIVIDRIVDHIAVCEESNRQMREIPISLLPEGVKEGDCLYMVNDLYFVDSQETKRRREHNIQLFDKLRKKGKEQ